MAAARAGWGPDLGTSCWSCPAGGEEGQGRILPSGTAPRPETPRRGAGALGGGAGATCGLLLGTRHCCALVVLGGD